MINDLKARSPLYLRGIPWKDWLAFSFLAVALTVGGAGESYPLLRGLIAIMALLIIAPILARVDWASLGYREFGLFAAIAASFALVVLQVIPLPRDVYATLPLRDTVKALWQIAGVNGWRAWSVTPDETLFTLSSLVAPLAALLLGWCTRPAFHERAVKLFIFIAVASALLAIVQISAGPDDAPVLFATRHRGLGTGLFVNRNHLALFLTMAMIALTNRYFGARPGHWTPALPWPAVLLVVLAMGTFATLSRTGVVLALLIVPVLVVRRVRTRVPRGSVRSGIFTRASAAVALVVIVPCGLVLSPIGARLITRLGSSSEDLRFHYWANTLLAIQQTWPWGTGLGSFRFVYAMNEPVNQLSPDLVNHAHNDFLELALETGLAGCVILAVVAALLGTLLFTNRVREGQMSDRLKFTSTGALVLTAAAGMSLVDFPLRMPALQVATAFLVGIDLNIRGNLPFRPSSPKGYLRVAIVTVAALVLIGGAATLTVSQAMYRSGMISEAHRLLPINSAAWAADATSSQLTGDPSSALRKAKETLRIEPLNAEAVRVAGMSLIAQGRGDLGADILSRGALLGWRDTLLQLWLGNEAIKAGAYGFAVQRIDALVRQNRFFDANLNQLALLTRTEGGRAALSEQLAFMPGWRGAFFNTLARSKVGAVDKLALLARLSLTPAPATPTETELLRAGWSDAGEYAAAQSAWQLTHPRGTAPLIGNGDFEGTVGPVPLGGAPYVWRAPAIAGVRVEIAGRPQGTGGQAALIYSDGLTGGIALAQTLLLPPGSYVLRYALTGVEGEHEVLVSMSVSCPGSALDTHQSRAIVGVPANWQAVQSIFTIPTGCPRQEVSLIIPPAPGRAFTMAVDSMSIRHFVVNKAL